MSPAEEQLLAELAARRSRLESAAGADSGDEKLVRLLRQVDAALAEVEQGGWGQAAPAGATVAGQSEVLEICLERLSTAEQRALERDLAQAASVQRRLLPPKDLEVAGWETAWFWQPKGAVSGDYLDLLPPCDEGEPLHALLGDVAGKGVAASLLQSHLHALFRALIAPCPPVADLMARANRQFFAATPQASYATLLVLRLQTDGMVELANAGHPRPLLADRRGVRPVEGSCVPLGLFRDAHFASHRLLLNTGDTLLLYSDGWSEAARGEEEFGVGRAAAALRRAAALPLPELLHSCRCEMEVFLGDEELVDDLSLLALRRVAPART